jgi:hypothetical protein
MIQLVVGGGVFLAVMALRMRGMTRARPLRVEQLWVIPLVFAVITALTFAQAPPSMNDVPWLVGIAVIGAIVGWYRGKTMRITVDPETHAVNQSASPIAMLLLLAVFGLRYGLRFVLQEEASTWGVTLNLLTDAPLLFVVAMFALTRVEMFIRAQRLLREARAAKTGTTQRPSPG